MPKTKKTIQDYKEDALYREVSEEVQAQKVYSFLTRHIKLIITAASIAVIGTAALVIARHVHMSGMMEIASQYESAMDMAPNLSREALARLAKSTRGGMGDLAAFRAYQLALESGDRADALAKLETLAQRGSTRDFRDLATVQLAVLKGDDMDSDAFQKLISPLLSKRSPFYFTGLLLGAEKHLAAGKTAEARVLLRKITSDKDAPASISATAEMMIR